MTPISQRGCVAMSHMLRALKLKGSVKPLRRLYSRLPAETPSTVTISVL